MFDQEAFMSNMSNKQLLINLTNDKRCLSFVYINDVVEAFRDSKCTCKLYGDDLKIYRDTIG